MTAKIISFAEGLKALQTGKAAAKPVSLNKDRRIIILELINYSRLRIHETHPYDGQEQQRLLALLWMEEQITKPTDPQSGPLTKTTARELNEWVSEQSVRPLSGHPEFGKAMQWVASHWKARWSQNEL